MEQDLVLKYTFQQYNNHEFELTLQLEKYFEEAIPAVYQCPFMEILFFVFSRFSLSLTHKILQACP